VESQKEMLRQRLSCLMGILGGSVEVTGDYPAWEYRADSPLRELMVEVYREQYGKEPKIEAIHAGLECGLFAGKLPGLNCVSIGPDLTEIHTTRGRMHISSVRRVWEMTVEVLRRMK
jgi:dipeptidase D